jgi:hypothetical protein
MELSTAEREEIAKWHDGKAACWTRGGWPSDFAKAHTDRAAALRDDAAPTDAERHRADDVVADLAAMEETCAAN